MQLGVVFPQTEIGPEPDPIREYALAAEAAGYEHLLVYDHVLGADPNRPEGFSGPYDKNSLFHEPLVLFGYLAGITDRLELVTGILVLTQRQTALVAKQATEVDLLSNGRLRLGIGVGWNSIEFEALGENFYNRGRRVEEQIEVLRALWSKEAISFEGNYHSIVQAGINPLPLTRSIPIWIGGMSEPVIERVGRLSDGWFPQYRDPSELPLGIERVHAAAEAAGRSPTDIGIEARVQLGGDAQEAATTANDWIEAGATHISVNTMNAGYTNVAEHIEAIEQFRKAFVS